MTDGVSAVIRKGRGPSARYLLIQQPGHKPLAGKWLCVSGKIEEGETPGMAAVRESREEASLRVRPLGEAAVLPADYGTERLHFVLAEWRSGEPRMDPSEVAGWGWFTLEEALGLDLMKATREFFARPGKVKPVI
jgi:8-oxo-dGTP pyrophosphatase MutT (NUDIX family)